MTCSSMGGDASEEVERLVQACCQEHHFTTFRRGRLAAQARPQPGSKDLNLTADYISHKPASTSEQVQNWIDQMNQHVRVPGNLRVQSISLPAWDVIVAGEQDSRTILGYAASSSSASPRLLRLCNYGASMSLDTLSLGYTTSRGTHTAVGGSLPDCNALCRQ